MKIVNALSFDIEEYFQVAALSKAIGRTSWDEHPNRVTENTKRILDELAKHDVKATFFILGWVAERAPGLVRTIADQGHEIASHGYSHQLVYKQQPEEFREETRRSKSVLEDQAQAPVTSYRAASYSITPKSLWALDVLYEEGFRSDSSIFPIRHDLYGLSGGPDAPYHIELPCGGRLLEFPISTTRFAGINWPVSGGGYFRLYPYPVSRFLANRLNRKGAPFVFYLHPWEVDPEHPDVEVSGFSRFRHYNNLKRTMPRLQNLLQDFRFSTITDCISQNFSVDALPVHRYS